MSRHIIIVNLVFDYFLLILSIYGSLWLRFNGEIPGYIIKIFFHSVWFIAAGKIIIFYLFRVYKIMVRFIHTYDVINILKVNIVATLFFGLIIWIFRSEEFLYPRGVVITDFFLSFLFISGLRFFEKYILGPARGFNKQEKIRVLIIGAGGAGSMVLREIRNHPDTGMTVIGFIDDDKSKFNMAIGGKRVLGGKGDIVKVVKNENVNLIIIAIPSAHRKDINDIVEICEDTSAKMKIVPSTYDIIKGDVKFNQIRDINIEDLLGREEIKFDSSVIEKYIKNKVVLITGAGGSIGSEITRQVAHFKPKKLILAGKGENSIFNINLELGQRFKGTEIIPVISDINNKSKMEELFKQYKPHILFHAAAHKHVYLMELHPDEAFKNNVLGTLTLAGLSMKYDVQRFILISTDKAVNPASVMGMTKRIAEKIVIGYNQAGKKTIFACVRFGNVLGSRGSVVPIFKKQIEQGGPVTVTHPEVKRYFMTIPEAVQLVLEAGGAAKGGEIFILDMGDPIKIIDLARKMIKLSGFIPDKDIRIKYIGLKPGEKLFEELVIDNESVNRTEYEKILIASPERIILKNILDQIAKIGKDLYTYDKKELKSLLKRLT